MTQKKRKSYCAHCLRRVLGMEWGDSHRLAAKYIKLGFVWPERREAGGEAAGVGSMISVLTEFGHMKEKDFAKYGVEFKTRAQYSYRDERWWYDTIVLLNGAEI